MPWYAEQNAPDGQLHLKKTSRPPGNSWVEIPGTNDSMTEQQAAQQLAQDAASGAFGYQWANPDGLNPFADIADTAHAIAATGAFFDDAWKQLTNWRIWASLGWLILGVGMMILGVVLWVKQTMPSPVSVAL